MLTTLIYILGALSLHFTDMGSGHGFYSLFLPTFNGLFFIFLLWQVIFYYSLSAFDPDDTGFFGLLYHVVNIQEIVIRHGLVLAFFRLLMLVVDAICLFTVIFFYLQAFMDFVAL